MSQPPHLDQSDPEAGPLDAVLTEFTNRLRHGEQPTIQEYERLHPRFVAAIRELFPTIQEMESLKRDRLSARSGAETPAVLSVGTTLGAIRQACDLEALGLHPPQATDELGRLGNYRILKLLGCGGMGAVFVAEDTRLRRTVALKVMLPTLASQYEARERFLREARLAASIEHENIVTIHQVDEDAGVPFFTMPLLAGLSLEDSLRSGSSLDVRQIVDLCRQIAQGLAAAHERGLIHRDVKPANIWLRPATDQLFRVTLLDFGLARPAIGDKDLTQSGTILGTPAYMAPEQVIGEGVDGRADLFSLGVILYRLCTGQLPFPGANPMAVFMALASRTPAAPHALDTLVPRALSALILELLERDTDRRPASAHEVVDRLREIEAELAHRPLPGVKQASRNRSVFWIVGTLASVVVALGWWWYNPRQDILPVRPNGSSQSATHVSDWRPLFNGKDLTGWKYHPLHQGHWRVEEGVLVGSGPKSWLFTERDDFGDFHFRAEVKINFFGDSGIFFWTTYELNSEGVPVEWHEAQIFRGNIGTRTGSLNGQGVEASVRGGPQLGDDWFTLEIQAVGQTISTKVNGHPVAELETPVAKKGHLALQVFSPQTFVQFRSIEIREQDTARGR